MIRISDKIIRKQHNFWNNCIFHPTDAVEDPWGRRILDRMSADRSIDTVRIYSMFEDIVYLGEEGEIRYDFRLSDMRLDYLVERGYNVLLSYAGMPDCIASTDSAKTIMAKKESRYKGKFWNSMPPKDYKLWEDVCYEYTKHIIERYGIETVSKWYIHCYNEPDMGGFWLSNLPKDAWEARFDAYCPLYESFQRAIRRIDPDNRLSIGGPALANSYAFLRKFLNFVKENSLRIDYVALHNYGTYPEFLLRGESRLEVENNIKHHLNYLDIIKESGLRDLKIVIDEWGMSSHGYLNAEDCPPFIARENEVFAAYYTKLVKRLIDVDPNITKLMICLSGQHEMTEDFSGFRNFFTLNHFAKPIYNAHLMASRLGTLLLSAEVEDENIALVPTKTVDGEYSVMLSYSSKYFDEDIKAYTETLAFSEDLSGKRLTVYLIDKEHTNPYRLAQKLGVRYPSDEEKRILRDEGKLKPVHDAIYDGNPIELELTPNCTYLIRII